MIRDKRIAPEVYRGLTLSFDLLLSPRISSWEFSLYMWAFHKLCAQTFLQISWRFTLKIIQTQHEILHQTNLGTYRKLLHQAQLTNQTEILMDNLTNQVRAFTSSKANELNKDFNRQSHKSNESFYWLSSQTKQ